MAAEDDCSSDQPFVSELVETKAVVAEEGHHEDIGIKGEVASDGKTSVESTGIREQETVREQSRLSNNMETQAEGVVPAEATEKLPIPEVDGVLAENEARDGYLEKSTEATVKTEASVLAEAEGMEEAPSRVRGEEPNEDSSPNNASDAAPDAKTRDEIVHDMISEKKETSETADETLEDELNLKLGIEVGGCIEVEQRESVKDEDIEHAAKETIGVKVSEEEELVKLPECQEQSIMMCAETAPADTVESKPEEQQTEEELVYDPDQNKENEPLAENDVNELIESVGIEVEHNVAIKDVGSKSIISEMPLTESEAAGEYAAKEQMKDGRAGAELEEKLVVEDAVNEITEAKETERLVDPTDGAQYLTLEPEKASEAGSKLSELVAMDQAAEAAEGEPNGTDMDHEAPEKAGEFRNSENADASAERIVREINEPEQAIMDDNKNRDQKCDSTKKPLAMPATPNMERNPSKEDANGKQSGKLMSRVKSSLGKVRKAILWGRSPSTKTIIVDARLEEKVQ